MKRPRWIFNLACAISLLVFLATIGFMVRAQFAVDKLDFVIAHRHVYLGSFMRHFYGEIDPQEKASEWDFTLNNGAPIRPQNLYSELRFGRTNAGSIYFGIPHWLILLLSAPLPAWWLWTTRNRKRRIARHECLTCGYDLRASPDRCPECGTPVATLNRP